MQSRHNLKAAGLVVLAMALISANDAIIKLISESLSIGQILLIRGIMASLLISLLCKKRGIKIFSAELFGRWTVARAGCETMATLCFVTALSLLPIAIASTLVWTAPIFLTLFSVIFLAERVALRRWTAVTVGFAGILLVTNPWGSEATWVMILPLAAAFMVALRDILTRKVRSGIDVAAILLPTLLSVTLVGAALSIFDWRPVSVSHVATLAVSALLLSGGFYSHISAVRIGELSFIAPFSYTGIISALIWGMLIWGDFPTMATYLGIALICASGLYILHRGGVIRR